MLNRWQRTIVDLRGNVVPYAQLQILREQTQSAPTIYRDKAGTEAIPNAIVTANQNGYAYFYAPADLYRIRSSQPTIDWRDVDVGSAAAQQLAQQALDNAVPTYETLVDIQADTSQPAPTLGRVVNDSVLENNGYYVWTGTAWDRAAYQPLSDMDVSIDPAPGKIPLAGGSGTIKQAWVSDLDFELEALRVAINRLAYGDGPYPTLDLRFAGATLLDPRVEFSRGSTATGTGPTGRIYTAAIDEPRFVYDPATGSAQGLLVEGQATNLLLWSEDFTQTGWHVGSVLGEPTPGAESPLGVPYSRYEVQEPGTRSTSILQYTPGFLAGDRVTISVFVSDETNISRLGFNLVDDSRVIVDLDEETIIALGEGVSDEVLLVQHYPKGRRISVSAVISQDGDRSGIFGKKGSGVSYNDNWVAGDVLAITGMQVNAGMPTSYIPTEGSQVTRAADTVNLPTDSFPFNPLEGTFFIDMIGSPPKEPFADSVFGLSESPSAFLLAIELSAQPRLRSVFSGYDSLTLPVGYAGGPAKIAISFGQDAIIFAVNGIVRETSNLIAKQAYDQAMHVTLGRAGLEHHREYGTYKRVTYYPRALSNAELQALTS